MQLVAVSVVKNEADVIEAFVRHTAAWADRHLILDHDSTDGTREILGRLVQEGLPLEVFTDETLGNLQQERSNALTRLAALERAADWILPLDADEFVAGPDRNALAAELGKNAAQLRTWPLWNHVLTGSEDPDETNPVVRLRHCEPQVAPSRKILIPRTLALDPTMIAGKGSHAMTRETQTVRDEPLPETFFLAHFPERSIPQVAARIALAELQKLGRGAAHAGVDLHYRLPFQTLAANPALFARSFLRPESEVRPSTFTYLGGALRCTPKLPEWERLAAGFLPFLEKLATRHGRLVDAADAAQAPEMTAIRPMTVGELGPSTFAGRTDAFAGFRVVAGLGPNEGPVPAAYLPTFRWGMAPETVLTIEANTSTACLLEFEALTYSPRQVMEIRCDDAPIATHSFGRTEQRERLRVMLPVGAGTVKIRYRESLRTERDGRALAVIFLALRIS